MLMHTSTDRRHPRLSVLCCASSEQHHPRTQPAQLKIFVLAVSHERIHRSPEPAYTTPHGLRLPSSLIPHRTILPPATGWMVASNLLCFHGSIAWSFLFGGGCTFSVLQPPPPLMPKVRIASTMHVAPPQGNRAAHVRAGATAATTARSQTRKRNHAAAAVALRGSNGEDFSARGNEIDRGGGGGGGPILNVVVTGANRGLGFAIADRVADLGHRVVLACRGEQEVSREFDCLIPKVRIMLQRACVET